jgi:hypothetical protein
LLIGKLVKRILTAEACIESNSEATGVLVEGG